MKLNRFATVPVVLTAGAIALAGCGSDNSSSGGNSSSAGSTSSAPAASTTGGGGSTSSTAPAGGGGTPACGTGTLSSDGSSAQKPAIGAWIAGYQKQCSQANISYAGQGSGEGITGFTQSQIPFAGSDSHLKPEEQGPADKRCGAGAKAIDLPMVATPVAIIYNLKGVKSLTLTPDELAKIFSGKISKWNDTAIKATNKGVALPSTSISTVHRSADSGTTDNFTKFLDAQAKSDWPYGTGKAWKAPGGQGGKDSTALVSAVKANDGGIGYVDGPDATKNDLTPAKLDTGSGPVAISKTTVGAALTKAKIVQTGQDIEVDINYGLKQAGAYPAILVTYEITCTKGLPATQAKFVKSFLTYTASTAGQALLEPIGHLPLPDSLIAKVRASIAKLPS